MRGRFASVLLRPMTHGNNGQVAANHSCPAGGEPLQSAGRRKPRQTASPPEPFLHYVINKGDLRMCSRGFGSRAVSILLFLTPFLVSCSSGEQEKIEQTRAKAERWADKLDVMTDDSGVYTRWDGDTLPEDDSWGNSLRVVYAQGGVAEKITIRSLGPDGQSHTEDDITAVRASANFSGIGAGIQENIEGVAEGGARGAARGFIGGIKEGIDEIRKEEQDKDEDEGEDKDDAE